MPRYRGKELERQWARISAAMDARPAHLCQMCGAVPWTVEFDAILADLQTHHEEGGELHVQAQRKFRFCQHCLDMVRAHPLTQRAGDA